MWCLCIKSEVWFQSALGISLIWGFSVEVGKSYRLGGMGGNYSLKTWNRGRSQLIFSFPKASVLRTVFMYHPGLEGWLLKTNTSSCQVLENVFELHGLHLASRISGRIKQNYYCKIFLLGEKNPKNEKASEIPIYIELYLLGFMSICSSATFVYSWLASFHVWGHACLVNAFAYSHDNAKQ